MAVEATTQAEQVLQRSSKVRLISRLAAWPLFDLTCVIGVNILLLWFFHSRFWYPPDEGNYAHVAQRMLSGEVLNLHIQDVHPGYINFVNAAAFRLFGLDLLSLRYPLVLIALVQAILVFVLFYRTDRRLLAVPAAIAINALGLIQFLNPTSNWYCLFLVVLIACSLQWLPRNSKSRLLVVGLLLGTLVLFRQLSGVLVCIGVLAFLLIEARSDANSAQSGSAILSRILIAIMAMGLGWYLIQATDVTGLLLFGFCPLLVLVWLFAKTAAENRQVLRILVEISIGGIVAALPLLMYHLIHGSLQAWLNDTVVSAVGLTKLSFIDQRLYGKLVVAGLHQAFQMSTIGELLNGFYWTILPLLAFANGIVALRFLSSKSGPGQTLPALSMLALFYAIVSIHFQIAVYLYYTVALSLAGLMWMVSAKSRLQYAVLALALLLSGIGVYYHAGQPLSGRFADIFGGRRNIMSLNKSESSLARASLKIEPDDDRRYAEILRLIESQTRPDEAIFALPSNAELYFLSGRQNPFRFYNSALGIRTPSDLQRIKESIITHPPKLVLYRADDKYNTDYSREIIRLVRERYDFLGETYGFAIYRARQTPAI